MPSLKCTYAEFLAILRQHGFDLHRHDGGSHQRWRMADEQGNVFFVDFAPHGSMQADIPIGTLNSMIRQSGLPKKLFIK